MIFTLILFLIGTLGGRIFRKYFRSLILSNSGYALKLLIPTSLILSTINRGVFILLYTYDNLGELGWSRFICSHRCLFIIGQLCLIVWLSWLYFCLYYLLSCHEFSGLYLYSYFSAYCLLCCHVGIAFICFYDICSQNLVIFSLSFVGWALLGFYRLHLLVIIHKMRETERGYHGSKGFGWANPKEQRLNGNKWRRKFLTFPHLRYNLMDFERHYQAIIPSNQINIHRAYSTQIVSLAEQKYPIDPQFITGFTDGSYKNQVIKRLISTKRSCTKNHQRLAAQQSTSLVVWGTNLSSSVWRGRITKQESHMIKLPPYQMSVIIGLLLSDGWLSISSSTHKNARLGFAQGADNSKYFYRVFFFSSLSLLFFFSNYQN